MDLKYFCPNCGNNDSPIFPNWKDGDPIPVVNCTKCEESPEQIHVTDENRDSLPQALNPRLPE